MLCQTWGLLLAGVWLLCLQGEYCVQIKMDILPGSGIAVVGTQSVRVPATAQSIVRQVSQGLRSMVQGLGPGVWLVLPRSQALLHCGCCPVKAANVDGTWSGGALGDASGLCGDCSASAGKQGEKAAQTS